MYIPPGFQNITWKMFIIFGIMCLLGATQFFFTYPETAGKTLEEIEAMFAPGGPKAWHTKRGHSKLDSLVDQVRDKHFTIADAKGHKLDHHEHVEAVGDEKA